jgi:diguanylate cyclase (GGDEF)-like protein/PAS domain S-box-containing protein
MDKIHYTKEQLLERIEELEILNHELLQEKEQETKLEYAWSGNLGHWYWNVKTNTVLFNPLKITTLGYDENEVSKSVGYQFFTDKLHPEDYQKTMDAMLDHLNGKSKVYEVEYRIQAKNGKYKWFYDRGKITQFDEEGRPLFLAGIVFDITEKKELQMDLEYKNKILAEMSAIDGLTKISNHRTLIEYLKREIAEVNKTRTALSIAMFDIDDFKKVNDSKGHVCGDRVLVDVAASITKNIRSTDFAGRYGGEEFLVIFPKTNLSIAAKIAERIRIAVEQYRFGENLQITISGGLKQYEDESVMEFIRGADECLYKAKMKGKNQIESYLGKEIP